MKIKLLGCGVFISPLFMGMITLLLLVDQTGFLGLVLAGMALHELGHLVMMVMVGCPPKEMRFLPFEINIISNQACSSRWERVCISVGGIIVNGLIFLVFVDKPFGYINLYLALFHALPLYSLDGYQILTHLLGQNSSLVFGVSALFTIGAIGAGCWLLVHQQNPMLFLFGLYLLVLGVGEKRKNTSG